MRGLFPRIAVCSLVVTLATPTSLAFGASGTDGPGARPVPAEPAAGPPSVPVPELVAPSTPVRGPSTSRSALRQAIDRATADVSKQARPGAARPASRGLRAQYGPGKGAMVMTLVSTLVGLAATVYMLKYIQQQSDQDDDGGGN
jgi:hypothetical protein